MKSSLIFFFAICVFTVYGKESTQAHEPYPDFKEMNAKISDESAKEMNQPVMDNDEELSVMNETLTNSDDSEMNKVLIESEEDITMNEEIPEEETDPEMVEFSEEEEEEEEEEEDDDEALIEEEEESDEEPSDEEEDEEDEEEEESEEQDALDEDDLLNELEILENEEENPKKDQPVGAFSKKMEKEKEDVMGTALADHDDIGEIEEETPRSDNEESSVNDDEQTQGDDANTDLIQVQGIPFETTNSAKKEVIKVHAVEPTNTDQIIAKDSSQVVAEPQSPKMDQIVDGADAPLPKLD